MWRRAVRDARARLGELMRRSVSWLGRVVRRAAALRGPVAVVVCAALVASLATYATTRVQQQQPHDNPGESANGGSGSGSGGSGGGAATAASQRDPVSDRAKSMSLSRRNPDGSTTTTLFASPVRYRDQNGKWRRIDSSLVATNQGRYRWHNAGNAFDVRFAEQTGEDLLQFTTSGDSYTLSAEDAAGGAGRVDGATVTYPDAYDDADLVYTATATGVKEEIIVDDADAPTSYTFRLSGPTRGPPLVAEERPDGSWAFFRAPRLEPAFVLPTPTVREQAPKHQVTVPDPDAKPRLSVDRDGRDYIVTLSVDADWLAAENRRFPVTIDPTITIQPDAQDGYFPTEPGWQVDTSFDRLAMGSNDSFHFRSSVVFDLGAVPADAVITDASLGLFFDAFCLTVSSGTCGSQHTLDVHRMSVGWDESSLSEDMDFDPTILDSYILEPNIDSRWMTWDVTDTVSSWVAGERPNFGFLMKRHTEQLGSSGPVPPGVRYAGETAVKPKLEVTYDSDASNLFPPDTLHSDGAELAWSRYEGSNPFGGYEVHRARQADFTPSPRTLLTTIRDPAITSYRDTTAAPETKFTYRIVTNGDPSPPQTVTLPADGQATKALQPGPAEGKAVLIFGVEGMTSCGNFGGLNILQIGTQHPEDPDFVARGRLRGLLRFDLHDIPPDATITDAELSLWKLVSWDVPMTVQTHRATRPWKEGTGENNSIHDCTGDGATWYETESGQPWTNDGADFDPTVVDTVDVPANEQPRWHRYQLTDLVQQWVTGEAPNHGIVFKISDETLQTRKWLSYAADDYTVAPALRPKLTVSYDDGSHAAGPEVAVSDPAGGAQVSGTVTVRAAANDDRRVEEVTFLVDGQQVATDSTGPFAFDWDTSGVGNGTHTLSARATDDAGNTTTSDPVTVEVQNSAAPAVTLTGPSEGATVSGTVAVSADAGDDEGVDRVEFLADGHLIATDATAPYEVSWDTLDPALPAYDGAHQLTAVAYDTDGQQTTSPAVNVTVGNTAGTKYQVDFETTALPPTAEYDPAPGADQLSYGVDVTITNTSDTTLPAGETELGYRWLSPDDPPTETSDTIALGSDVPPGGSTSVQLDIAPPELADGTDRATYQLMVDLHDTTAGTWFAAQGNPPPRGQVEVTKKTFVGLGLEHYYTYPGQPVGGGMEHLVNAASGNSLLTWTPLSSTGRGLSTVASLTYNSLEDHSKSPAGNNFSLAISGLTRLGARLDIHPNKADEIAGRSNKWVSFLDGDGTLHRFDGTTQPDGSTTWQEPPGVDLYLRHTGSSDPAKAWALTRPDDVTFYFTEAGYPTQVVDRNGNTMVFTLADVPPGEDPGGPKKRITKVTDPGGRDYTIDYYTKAEAKKPQIRGKIQAITDHSGHGVAFDYYHDGNLLRVTEEGGRNADGTPLSDRAFVFTYYNNKGDAPAIDTKAGRIDPDPKTPNQSVRLYSVWSPRDVAAGAGDGQETVFGYLPASAGPDLRWRLASRTGRDGQTTTVSYDTTARTTTITEPLSRATTFHWDAAGLVRRVVDPLEQSTYMDWTNDRQLKSVTDPTTGAAADAPKQEFTYNANGMLTSATNQAGERTELAYDNFPADAADPGQHLSLLTRRVNPKGTATPAGGDFTFDFGYNQAGNLTQVTFPPNPDGTRDAATNTYNGDGTLATTTDPRGNTTQFLAYDPSGQPTVIEDPAGRVTRVGYTPDGFITFIQDPAHAGASTDPWGDPKAKRREYATVYDYDAFHRVGRVSTPKSTRYARGQLIWTSRQFDPNNNVTAAGQPTYGIGDPGLTSPTRTRYDVMDRPTLTIGPDTTADPDGERTAYAYDAAGRMVEVVTPRGMATATAGDHTIQLGYDKLDRTISETRHDDNGQALTTQAGYDTVGDLIEATNAKGKVTTLAYDPAHRLTEVTDPEGRTTGQSYDANGNVTQVTDAAGVVTEISYDQRDRRTKTVEPHTDTRDLVTQWAYDPNGNVTAVIPPRAFDAAGGTGPFDQYVTRYTYNTVDELTRIAHPTSTDHPQATFTHRRYDPNGQLRLVTLPSTAGSLEQVPAENKTTLTRFDPGWIRSADDHVNPAVVYDYAPEGWQTSRTPTKPGGELDTAAQMLWTYNADGTLASRSDRGGQVSTYEYNPNNLLVEAVDGAGITDPDQKPREMHLIWNGLDQLDSIDHRQVGETNFTANRYHYDKNGDIIRTRLDGTTTSIGGTLTGGRRTNYIYDTSRRLDLQVDYGTTRACDDDRRIDSAFTPTGQPSELTIRAPNTTCTSDDEPTNRPRGPVWTETKQTTTKTYYPNQVLKTLTTKDRDGQTVESHDLSYLDPDGNYVGNRTRDTYRLDHPDSTACATSTCTARYTYDPRGRLVEHHDGHGGTTTYQLDPAGNITEQVTPDGTTTRTYEGNRLATATTAGQTVDYFYDPLGNLDCVTTAAGTHDTCNPAEGAAVPAELVTDHTYDYLDRQTTTRSYQAGDLTDSATYVYDALDRVVEETDKHPNKNLTRTTGFTYQGLSTQLAQEEISTDKADRAEDETKTYLYDILGRRLTMAHDKTTILDGGDTTTEEARYTYGHDPQTSVSMLLDDGTGTAGPDAETVKASYGYTPYGSSDHELTKGDTQPLEPINPFRFIGKYQDPATGSIDMGARRFSPDLARFHQRDRYYGVLADLNLSTDPLTGNRYAYAAGRPIDYVETDGHKFCSVDGHCERATPDMDSGSDTDSYTAPILDGWVGAHVQDGDSNARTEEGRPGLGVPPSVKTPGGIKGIGAGARAGQIGILYLLLSGDSLQNESLDIDYDKRSNNCFSNSLPISEITYYSQDSAGRARGAEACLAPGAVRLDDAKARHNPPGYERGKHHRGHLIARQFGGHVVPQNLVTLWPRANEKMRVGAEAEVRRRLNRGERVYYAAVPMYSPYSDNPDIPFRIAIYIRSKSGVREFFVENSRYA